MEDTADLWRPPLARPSLTDGDVHVWRVRLDWPEAQIAPLEALLSADEQERAARYRYYELRREYTAGRGALRVLLGNYLGIAPSEVVFTYEKRGRPRIAKSLTADRLSFNLSNARDLALIAFTRGREIGVDLESDRRTIEMKDVAAHFFAPAECAALFALPENEQRQAFFNCWTRKEAYLKARGLGLSRPLDRFQVTLVPGEPARLLNDETDPGAEERWSLAALAGLAGYTAALAVEGPAYRLSCFDFLMDPKHL
jgi:4'-phosphopantetheinyl transferase